MKPVIEVKNLSKSYDISHRTDIKASYGTLKDSFENLLKHPLKGGRAQEDHETFWALRDVSFEVPQGEIFGVVGQNGSGKSTLLKIMSRIVDPTEGSVHLRGRAASLLEVGTGFHPELTGRENIFLNGSMLGMGRYEIRRKFNDIVDFSEIEKFLDTPVKFYSSGMYVRLAFSIAAHLEPEILILDEVLAVGDTGFQKKSMNKILSSIKEGRTVVIVSHSMTVLTDICTSGLLLKNGTVKAIGDIEKVASVYAGILPKIKDVDVKKLTDVTINDSEIKRIDDLTTDGDFTANLYFHTNKPLPNCYVNLHIENGAGVMAVHARTDHFAENPTFKKGEHTVRVHLPRLGLIPGTYSMWFRLYSKEGPRALILDSSRITFEVNGKEIESISPTIMPATWHFGDA